MLHSFVFCAESTLKHIFSWQSERQETVNVHLPFFLESVNRNLEVGALARTRISVYILIMF